MHNVNPMIHMDDEFMWRWYEIGDDGRTAFMSPRSFFSHEECRRNYDAAMKRSKFDDLN